MKQDPTAVAAPQAPLEAWLRRNGASALFRALADLVPNAAVVAVDADGDVVYWSREAERLLGHRADERVGRPCPRGTVCDPGGVARVWGSLVQVTRADGTPVQVRHYAHRVEGPDGPGGLLALLQWDPGFVPQGPAQPEPDDVVDFHGLRTRDPAMLRVLQTVRNVAETDTTILVRGESGTGKELVAQAIHRESARRDKPLVSVNCAAFTPTLLESELFGHVKGAFTGAIHARKGIFAQADGGTLFLDEVGELSPDLQSRLLRVLQERVFQPVGSNELVHVDIRVIAATHRALREEARAGRFREDLLYRLRVVPIFLPALRERRVDIEVLLRQFIATFDARGGRRVDSVDPAALRALLDYRWPGNVRELRNVVEYAYAVGRGTIVTLDDLPPEVREPRTPDPRARPAPEPPAADPPASDRDRERLVAALADAAGDLGAAAARLGVSRTTFWRMRRRLGV